MYEDPQKVMHSPTCCLSASRLRVDILYNGRLALRAILYLSYHLPSQTFTFPTLRFPMRGPLYTVCQLLRQELLATPDPLPFGGNSSINRTTDGAI